jgi:hypothetical protein
MRTVLSWLSIQACAAQRQRVVTAHQHAQRLRDVQPHGFGGEVGQRAVAQAQVHRPVE